MDNRAFRLEVKRQGSEAENSPPTSVEGKKIHSPISLEGVVLDYLNTRDNFTVPYQKQTTPVTGRGSL
jgi:hypothetical protein